MENSCCNILTSENDVSGLLGNSHYPVDRPIPESRSGSHSQELSALILQSCPTGMFGTLKLANLIESTRLSRMSPFIHIPNPLGWESIWIAEVLLEKVELGIINCEECILEKDILQCLKTQFCYKVSIQ